MILHHIDFPIWALVVIGIACLWAFALGFYILYAFAVNVWAARAEVGIKVLILSSPALLLMLITDLFANPFVFTPVCWDWPKELLVTTRMKRYRAFTPEQMPPGSRNARRRHIADELCERALNPLAPNKHHC